MNVRRHNQVLHHITLERERQDELRDDGRFPFTCADNPGLTELQKYAALGEEVGEIARACLGREGLVIDGGDLYKELIQTAAVAVAWAESL